MTKTRTKAGATGEALLGNMQAIERALAQPPGPSPDQLITRIQEWQQGVTELVRQQELGVELATLYEIAGLMSSSLDLAETLDLVMDALIHLTGAERGCLMLLNDEGHPQVRAAQSFDQESLDAYELELSRSVVREAIGTGQSVLTTNAQRDPRFSDQESVIGYHLRSIACVPLRAREEVIGALYLDNRIRDGAFSETDLQTLTAFANQATVAIQNARLYTTTDQALTRRMEELTRLVDQEQSHAAELATLNSLSQALTARLDVEQVLDEAYRGVSQLLDTDSFYIALYDPDKDEVTFSIDVAEGDVLKSATTRRAGKGPTEHILRTQKPLLIREDVPARLKELGIEPIGRMAHSWLGVPLTIGDQALGVMAVQNYTGATSYNEHDRDLLMAIASQTAIALYNARLYEQAQFEITERRRAEEDLKQRNDELTTLYEAATATGSALSLDDVLLTVAKQMIRAIESTGCALSLWNREQNSVETLVDYSLTSPDDSDPPGTTYDLRDYPATRRVLETGRPIVVQHDDPMADETEVALMRDLGIRTLLMLPLVTRDQVFGLVELVDEVETRNYTIGQIRLAQSLAVQAAISIENARLYEEAQSELAERRRAEQEAERRAAQTALIYEVGQRVSSELELETLLSEIVSAVQDAFDYYSVMLMLLDETGERLVLQSVAGHYVDVFPDNLWVAVSEGMTGRAATTGETQLSGDVSQHPHYVRKTEEATRSELTVAIRSGQQILGVLDLQSDELDAFDATDVMLMETLADQVAVAIENARLYEETQLRLREQTMLFDISQRLSSAPLRAKEIAEIGIREIAALMESTECSISLYDPQEDVLHTLADLWIEDGVEHWEDAQPYSLSDYPATVRIMETLQPLVVQSSDPNADSAELAYLRESESATLAMIPLTIKGQAIGLLELETDDEHHYTQRELNVAMTLANQVAAALDNARLYETVQQELTERKRAEQARQASLDILNTVLDSVDADVYVADLDSYEILFMNKHMKDGFGHDLVGRICHEVFRNETRPCSHCTNDQLLDADGHPTGVCIWEGHNPITENWYINYDRAVRWIDGRFVRLQVATDITKVKQAEETLRRQRGYLDALHETTLGLIGRLELGELLETLIARAAALVGAPNGFVYLYDPESGDLEMRVGLGDNADDVGIRLGPGEGVAGLVWQTGQPVVVEDYSTWAGRSMDTRLAHAHSAMGIPLKSGAHAVGVIGLSHSDRSRRFGDDEIAVLSRFAELASIALDNAQLYSSLEQELAERQRAEERLQRYAAELEQSNEEVRRFAYIVSHDLRAPLVNLKGFSAELRLALGEIESAVSTVDDHLDEEQKQALTYALQEDAPEALAFIDTSVTHMDHFITALLKLSRLGRRELQLELVDVDGIVETCLQTLAHQIAESQTEVSVGELPEIVADQTSIEQIVGNILSNAIKYLHPDRPGKVEITAVRGEDETLFQIRDNGRGIGARNMDKVFAPFRRAGNEDVPGDGMGLAYVQALVRRHAGRIWCESEPGVGTLMSFTIPHHLGDDDYV